MLTLFGDSLLLLFLTMGAGTLTRRILEKLFRRPVDADFLGLFLLGLMLSTFYFSLVSLCFPVNQWSLIPLGLVAIIVFIKDKTSFRHLRRSVRTGVADIFSSRLRWLTIGLIALLIIEWLLPPSNPDGFIYHYLSIGWYEKFKVVPGLANLNERFGFNPASFIIEAAYSFTGVTGQALYPLNGVSIALLFCWLLRRLARSPAKTVSWIWALLILLLYRPLLVNMSNPTSDVLVAVSIVWSFITLARHFSAGSLSLSTALAPAFVLLYAFMAKLSALPELLALPLVFLFLPKNERKISLLLRSGIVTLLMYLPWMVRNYILSGYLLYPVAGTNWGHPDWQLPAGPVRYELYYIYRESKIFPHFMNFSTPLPLSRWFPLWYRFNSTMYPIDVLLSFLAMLAPLFWLSVWKRKKLPPRGVLLLWLIAYGSLWLWFFSNPQPRFGAIPVILVLLLPALGYAQNTGEEKNSTTPYGLPLKLLFVAVTGYYGTKGLIKLNAYSGLKDCLVLPKKDPAYDAPAQTTNFPYRVMNTGVKLYVEDSTHFCINTSLPCAHCIFGTLEMRGTRLDQGFRIARDSTLDYFPYVR